MEELRREGVVEAEFGPEPRHRRRVGAFTDHGLHGIPRRDVEEEEYDDKHPRQCGQREEQAAGEQGEHERKNSDGGQLWARRSH